jgi:CRISPR-associated exonuclease Cas4
MEEELLPVSLIRQYFFCPQIPYINMVLHVVEPETESMISGRTSHEKFRAQHLPRNMKPRRIATEVPLSSPKLGLCGILDALVETVFGELVPCEMKNSSIGCGNPPLKDRAQLTAYAMLVEEQYRKTVKRGVLFYREDGRKVVLTVDESMRRLVIKAVREIRGIVEAERMPERKNLSACPSCWYNRICRSSSSPAPSAHRIR